MSQVPAKNVARIGKGVGKKAAGKKGAGSKFCGADSANAL
jgi:hypothetical protein